MVISPRLADAVHRIETCSLRDPGNRGLASFACTRELLSAADELLSGKRVILVTGFCIRASLGGESDGPPGALALADALHQLGKEVLLVSDEHSTALLSAGAACYGAHFPTVSLSRSQKKADREMLDLLFSFSPTQVIAIERPGSAPDGHRYSMRGEILDDIVPATDALLTPSFPRHYTTFGIGDGGNELGLGSLRDSLKHKIPQGNLIFCATPADYVIPAGVSNWGAYALVAAMSLLSGQRLLKSPEHEQTILDALLTAGAVDGCTQKRESSVDGLPREIYTQTLIDIHRETLAFLDSE